MFHIFINLKLGQFYFDSLAGRMKLLRGPHAARGPQVGKPCTRALVRILKLPVIFERLPVKKKLMLLESSVRAITGGVQGPALGSRGQRPRKLWGFTYFECLRRALLAFFNILLIFAYLWWKKTQIVQEKVQNWWSVCLDSKLILCWFCSTCCNTNPKLDGNWKISANVIHFFSFDGMLWFSPSSHFFLARQNRKLPVKMTGMTGPS